MSRPVTCIDRPQMSKLLQLRESWLASEAVLLRETLTAQRGNLLRSAAALDCQVSTLQRALARHPELTRLRTKLRNSVTSDTASAKAASQSEKSDPRVKLKNR